MHVHVSTEEWAKRLTGERLGRRYRLDRLLGVGGMGAVFEATHTTMSRRVAVKVLLPSLARDETYIRRFQREARMVAQVAGRGVPQLFDLDVDAERGPFIVMEYLSGETLDARIRKAGSLPLPQALLLMDELLAVLGPVHDKGILHRDLKPPNLFVARQENGAEVLKVLDFGVARVLSAEDGTLALTQPGTAVGTPVYMAPEQLRGDPNLDARADLYSASLVLYECLAGRIPFGQTSLNALVAAVVGGLGAPLRSVRPDLPAALCEVVDRGMALSPDDRYDSAQEMQQALRRAAQLPLVGLPRTSETPATHPGVPATRALPAKEERSATPIAKPSPAGTRGVSCALVTAAAVGGVVLLSIVAGAVILASLGSDEREPSPPEPLLIGSPTPDPSAPAHDFGHTRVTDGFPHFPTPAEVAADPPPPGLPSTDPALESRLSIALDGARGQLAGGDRAGARERLRDLEEAVSMRDVPAQTRAAEIAVTGLLLAGDLESEEIAPAELHDTTQASALMQRWISVEANTTRPYYAALTLGTPARVPCAMAKVAAVHVRITRAYRLTRTSGDPGLLSFWGMVVEQNSRSRLDAAAELLAAAVRSGEAMGGGGCTEEARALRERLRALRAEVR